MNPNIHYPLVSIIIATKNEEKNILRLLKSIKKQDYSGKIETIIVDNYSTDKTVKIAKLFTSNILLAGPERSTQRNIGAKKAKGTWLLFLDSDMELTKDIIRECIEITRTKMIPPIIVMTEKAIGSTFWGKALALERNCYKNASWLQAARIFPKKYFQKLGGYDETLISGEDWDITQRFRIEGFPAFTTKKSYLYHFESKENVINLLKKEAYYIKHINKYALKHPLAFSYQGSFLYRGFIWIRFWNILIKHPLQTTAFMFYKFIVWCMWMWYKNKLRYT